MLTRFADEFLKWYTRVAVAVLITALAAVAVFLVPIVKRAEVTSRGLLVCKGNPACLESTIKATAGSVRSIAGEVAKAAPVIATSIKEASQNSAAASRATIQTATVVNELLVSAKTVVTNLGTTISDLDGSVKTLSAKAGTLIDSSDTSMKQTGADLVKLGELEDTLKTQIDAGLVTQAVDTLRSMQTLIDDPAIKNILDNADHGTKSLADTAETFNLATQDLRKKAGRIKWLINKLLGMLTVPLFK